MRYGIKHVSTAYLSWSRHLLTRLGGWLETGAHGRGRLTGEILVVTLVDHCDLPLVPCNGVICKEPIDDSVAINNPAAANMMTASTCGRSPCGGGATRLSFIVVLENKCVDAICIAPK